METSSFDAWIKAYRPDENSSNTSISYYTKGAVIGFLLDAKVRKATNGSRSLDDVMKLAYERYSGERGFTSEEFRAAVSEVAGADPGGWLRRALETTGELEYDEMLEWFGLRFRPEGGRPGAAGRASLGVTTRIDAGRLLVNSVRRGGAGMAAGLNVNDEILAIGDYRVRPEQLAARLAIHKPGDRVTLLVARRDRLERLDVTLGEEERRTWQLEARPDASDAQKQRLAAWLMER
jgi:predicted metalloprotease with PDZ domain